MAPSEMAIPYVLPPTSVPSPQGKLFIIVGFYEINALIYLLSSLWKQLRWEEQEPCAYLENNI